MIPALSPNTQAILLLTAPLIVGRGDASPDLLSPGEYKRLARHLREMQRQPADLLAADGAQIQLACQPIVDGSRLKRLLSRGFQLSQVIERWQTRAIWVVSRADAEYPRRLKARLREDAPAVLYGCGEIGLLESGGLAVVGSRHVDDVLVDYTVALGQLAARAGRTIVSGGARGIDQAAMRGALEAGGKASGVLADSLEKAAMNRENRHLLLEGQLVLVSPVDPSAGFNVGNAMQRNKLIYALADAAMVVSSDLKKGGTWAGAVEQLDKLRLVPVYVRAKGERSAGIDALLGKGALAWPEPADARELESVFNATMPDGKLGAQAVQELFENRASGETPGIPLENSIEQQKTKELEMPVVPDGKVLVPPAVHADVEASPVRMEASTTRGTSTLGEAIPADALWDAVRILLTGMLKTPMTDKEVAAALDVSNAQVKAWLQRLVEAGVLEKQRKPARYVVKQKRLFE